MISTATSSRTPVRKPIGKADILAALDAERRLVERGVSFKVESVERDSLVLKVRLTPVKGRRSTAIDESLEENKAYWGNDNEDFAGRGAVAFVEADDGAVIIDRWWGAEPISGQTVRFFQQNFVRPLIDVWESPKGYQAARELLTRTAKEPLDRVAPLPSAFDRLRSGQIRAVESVLYALALVEGPPGTGKTFALGAMIANFLIRFPNRRVLLLGPTNTASDAALASVDDWLGTLGRADIAKTLKRLGTHFDVKRYAGRQHLLAPGLYEKALAVLQAEIDEPSRGDFANYAIWKTKIRSLRKAVKDEVDYVAAGSRLIATTVTSAIRYYDVLGHMNWDLVVADEASQIPIPAALVLGGLGQRVVFAGDPRQLAPVVQEASAKNVMEKTAFDALGKRAHSVFLDEQSRMCRDIGSAVSDLFYGGRLRVCARAQADGEWQKMRSPYYVQERRLPHIAVKDLGGGAEAKWSKKYNGFIRYESAIFVSDIVDQLLASYVDETDIVVLTPFRSQRAMIREFFKSRGFRVDVSTVHRAQGSERKIVVFDPVAADQPFLNLEAGHRLLNVAFSRAQTHLIVPMNGADRNNPKMWGLRSRAIELQTNVLSFDRPPIFQ